MSEKIAEIEGIGPAYAEKLQAAGIQTTDDLLEQCCTPSGRKRLSEQTGLGEGFILKWANMADLMRVSGIGRQYAELLEAAGVDTIKELRQRNAENLAATMQEMNEAKKLSGAAPPAATVTDWIEKAKALEPKLTY
jgi:predicted flap endonuclease-1-like 5' DNA nuclease